MFAPLVFHYNFEPIEDCDVTFSPAPFPPPFPRLSLSFRNSLAVVINVLGFFYLLEHFQRTFLVPRVDTFCEPMFSGFTINLPSFFLVFF